MRKAINKSVRLFSEIFEPSGPVVEIGSLYQPGYESLCDLRKYFEGSEYIGCDIRHGLGVDRIEDAQSLSFTDNSIKTVLLLELLEHLPQPHKAVAEARRVLADDGLLVVSVPFNCRLHGYPTDYWRFTASGIHVLLSDFPDKVIFSLGPKVKPAFIFAVAAKAGSDNFAQRKALFQSRAVDLFQHSWMRGYTSVLKERARDLLGLMLWRADLSVTFFNPEQSGGYLPSPSYESQSQPE
ncbi:MAG: methyltransferase domain-containing protein [Chloroflexota bacterium]